MEPRIIVHGRADGIWDSHGAWWKVRRALLAYHVIYGCSDERLTASIAMIPVENYD